MLNHFYSFFHPAPLLLVPPPCSYGVVVAVFAAIMFIYLEFLNNLFQTAPLGGYWWLPFIATGKPFLCRVCTVPTALNSNK